MTKREEIFTKITEFRDLPYSGGMIFATLPGESDEDAKIRIEKCDSRFRPLLNLMRELDAFMPFERDPENGVWETLEVTAARHIWISVRNAMEGQEAVTVWSHRAFFAQVVEEWAQCRELSTSEDSEWDKARKNRMIMTGPFGEVAVIDRGANLMINRLQEAGCKTFFSCEGHPRGAYVGFAGDNADSAATAFEEIGWLVEPGNVAPGWIARMPTVNSVHERDAEWRKFSREFKIEVSPSLKM